MDSLKDAMEFSFEERQLIVKGFRFEVESRGNASVRKKETDMPITNNVAALSRVRLSKLEIHQSDLLDIEKFNYLRLLLIGTAATEIVGLPTTAANFEAVMHILNPKATIEKYMR
ncbi:hypothetical protein T08_13883 [Trichinella sp. T8]|nr:hypothetical protein T08_13883 [Trichinella sp. T8]